MGFRPRPRWLVWSLVLPLLALNGWVALRIIDYFRSFFTIAIAAALLAFILSYPVTWLQRFRLSRHSAVGVVVLVGVVIIGTAGLTLLPLLFEQLVQLSNRLPGWIASSTSNLQWLQDWAAQRQIPIDLDTAITTVEKHLSPQIQALSGLALGALPAAIANLLDIFLTLVLTIYLLQHGQNLWHTVFRWLPITTSRRLQSAISQSFHNYFISQSAVALMMGTAMTITFLLIQVPFGLLFGLGVGVLAMIPFGAGLGIAIVSALTAFSSLWLGLRMLLVAIVVDQVIEQAIAPSLISSVIGLNPVWILVALLIGAKVGGFLGIVIAVPVASSIKSLLAESPSEPLPEMPSESPPPPPPRHNRFTDGSVIQDDRADEEDHRP